MTDTTLGQDLERLADLKEAARVAQKAADEAKAEMEAFQQRVFERMADEDCLTHRTSKGVFSAKRTVYSSVNDSEAFEEWLEQNDLLDEFTRRTPEKGRLNELIRMCLDTRQEPPPGTTWYEKQYISVSTD